MGYIVNIQVSLISQIFDKPKVVIRSQSQKLTTWFSLESHFPTIPALFSGKVSKKQDRAITPNKSVGFM